MAISGLYLVFFLLMHMVGNMKLLMSAHDFDHYAHFLREFPYPILPKKVFLWIFRGSLLLAAVLHMYSASRLTVRNYKERGGSSRARYVKQRYLEKSFAARTMIWGGIILALGLVFHLLQFTAEVVTVGYPDGKSTIDPSCRVIYGFQEWWVLLVYFIFMAVVCLHIYHGFYSAFTTLGLNVGVVARKVLRTLSAAIAAVLFIGFMAVPVLISTGVIQIAEGACI